MSSPAAKSPYAGYRFPAEVISQAVWLYFRWHRSLIAGWAVKFSVQRLSGDARAVMGVPVGSWFSPRSA